MKKRILLLIALAVSTCFFAHSALAAQKSFVFGVHPFKNHTTLVQMFTPLMKYLEKELGAEVTFKRARDYETAMNAIVAGTVDISYLGPSGFAALDMENPGKVRICAAVENKGETTFKGVIAAKKGSGVKTLQDLKGKAFAFGDRASTLSFYMPAHMLMEAGVFDSLDYSFYGTHDKVAANVLRGKAAAGGLKPAVAANYVDQGLEVIAESVPVYEHMIVVGSGVDDATYQKICAALLSVQDEAVYKSIKKSLTGFAKVKPSDYDSLKKVMKEVDAKVPK